MVCRCKSGRTHSYPSRSRGGTAYTAGLNPAAGRHAGSTPVGSNDARSWRNQEDAPVSDTGGDSPWRCKSSRGHDEAGEWNGSTIRVSYARDIRVRLPVPAINLLPRYFKRRLPVPHTGDGGASPSRGIQIHADVVQLGRHATLRSWWAMRPWRFESSRPHFHRANLDCEVCATERRETWHPASFGYWRLWVRIPPLGCPARPLARAGAL